MLIFDLTIKKKIITPKPLVGFQFGLLFRDQRNEICRTDVKNRKLIFFDFRLFFRVPLKNNLKATIPPSYIFLEGFGELFKTRYELSKSVGHGRSYGRLKKKRENLEQRNFHEKLHVTDF